MAHIHAVHDSDAHFIVDATTRTLQNVGSEKTKIMQYDHNSERFTFELPRYIEDHDMSLCNVVQVHYINLASATSKTEGVYEVDDFQIDPEDEEVVVGSWLISQNATQFAGSLNFLLRFMCTTGEVIDYAWHTQPYIGISVSSGIYCSEVVVEQYADIIEQWKNGIYSQLDDILDFINRESITQPDEYRKIVHSFTVGEDTEHEHIYMTYNCDWDYDNNYRYWNGDAYTIYRFPLGAYGVNTKNITSAIFHAHSSLGTYIEFSVLDRGYGDPVIWSPYEDEFGDTYDVKSYVNVGNYVSLRGSEYLYIRVSRGAIYSDIPVTLEVICGEPNYYALPGVTANDDGKFLRVVHGKWTVVDDAFENVETALGKIIEIQNSLIGGGSV